MPYLIPSVSAVVLAATFAAGCCDADKGPKTIVESTAPGATAVADVSSDVTKRTEALVVEADMGVIDPRKFCTSKIRRENSEMVQNVDLPKDLAVRVEAWKNRVERTDVIVNLWNNGDVTRGTILDRGGNNVETFKSSDGLGWLEVPYIAKDSRTTCFQAAAVGEYSCRVMLVPPSEESALIRDCERDKLALADGE